MKNFRNSVLLVATLAMVLSNLAGCASSGHSVGYSGDGVLAEIHEPWVENLDKLPEESLVRVSLTGGNIFEGFYLSYSPETTSILLHSDQRDATLSAEFNIGHKVYRVPLDKIVALAHMEENDHSRVAGVVVGITLVLASIFAVFAYSLSTGFGNS